MALKMGHANVTHRHQGLNLCCWMTSLEMLMQWKHNSIYGENRDEHTKEVIDAFKKNRGYSFGTGTLRNDYGLKQVSALDNGVASWKKALGASPILLSGKYGMARSGIGGHVVLAIGLSNSDKIVYMDPFRTGWKSNKYIYMTVKEAYDRVYEKFGVLDAWTSK
jgi:hypothetical protein